MPVSLHHRVADAETRLAIEETSFYNIGADEIDAWAEEPRQDACLFASFVVRLRAQFGEMELLLSEGLGRVPGKVQKVTTQ